MLEPKDVFYLIGGVVSAGVAYGVLSRKSKDHEERIRTLEKAVKELSEVKISVAELNVNVKWLITSMRRNKPDSFDGSGHS